MFGRHSFRRLLLLFAVSALSYIFGRLVIALNVEDETTFVCLGTVSLSTFDNEQAKYIGALFFLWAIVFSPLIEEYVFRHLIIRKLKKYMAVHVAIIISTLLFTILHTQHWIDGWAIREMLLVALSGLMYGYIFSVRDNMWDSYFVHASANALILLPKQTLADVCSNLSNQFVYGIATFLVVCTIFLMFILKSYSLEVRSLGQSKEK